MRLSPIQKQHGFMAVLALVFIAILPALVWANTLETSCLIKIDGVIYDATPCSMNSDDEGIINFGHLNLAEHQGYWVYLIEREDGRYDGFWNEEFGASHAHTSLGIMIKEARGDSECFANAGSLLCRNILSDTPIYDVELRSMEEGGHAVLAYLDGLEFEVQHPNLGALQPYLVEESADLDGDGRPETLISVGHGGNCCPTDITILSYRGDGFFTYLDEAPIPGGWGGVEIVREAGKSIIRVNDVPSGAGNLAYQRGQRDYTIVNGRPQLIADRTEFGFSSEMAGLNLLDVQSSGGQQKELRFDIDQDGQKDSILCGYWQRWGVLNCTAQISSASATFDMQCRHVSISNSVFGPNRSHRLLCDGDIVEY